MRAPREHSAATLRAVALCALALCALCCGAAAQIPLTMNYQVMLTDDADQPLADDTVELVFRLYEQEAGGGQVWTETHSTSTNSIGVASVVLGSITPLDILFVGPMWLQVEVDGEVMEPRRPLSAAPYAHFARVAEHAVNSDHLGAVPAESYALDDDLWQPGVLNDPSNPLEWSKLKNVPGGFADGIDNAGSGDGHSLDAYDGDPQNVVFVDQNGDVLLGWFGRAKLRVEGPRLEPAAIFSTASPGYANPAVVAIGDTCSGLAATGGTDGSYFTTTTDVGVAGFGVGNAYGGAFYGTGTGPGAFCTTWGDGRALWARADGSGYSGYFEGGNGVYAGTSESYPVLLVDNTSTSDYCDGIWSQMQSGVSPASWALYGTCYEGSAAYLSKSTDEPGPCYAVYVVAPTETSEGLYVQGTMTSTAPLAQVTETSRGREAVFGVSSPEVEIIASGRARLSGGAARVEFDRLFAESIAGPENLRITATPIGGWSALYLDRADDTGFEIRSAGGDDGIEFNWVAIGRAAAHERRPDVEIPDPNELKELERQKLETVAARHSSDPASIQSITAVRHERERPTIRKEHR